MGSNHSVADRLDKASSAIDFLSWFVRIQALAKFFLGLAKKILSKPDKYLSFLMISSGWLEALDLLLAIPLIFLAVAYVDKNLTLQEK